MNIHDYLARIEYAGERNPTGDVLWALQRAHLLAVPFENLDIHTGTKIVLELPRLYRKIVTMRRGGFCYELNGLFDWLLRELGFTSRLLMARVYNRDNGTYGREFDHMLCLVEADRREWLVDVGFGEFSLYPLEFRTDEPLRDANGEFLITRDDEEYFTVSRFSQEDTCYQPQYRFSTREVRLADFSEMCLYHQTSPLSSFTKGKVCSIATATGRITLTDRAVIVTERGERIESPIKGGEEFQRALTRYFKIDLPDRPPQGASGNG